MRRSLWCLVSLALAAIPLRAQGGGLREKISELFIFTAGKDPLFLGGTAGSDSATALHADHFVPSANADNGTLISFISSAISQNAGNLPVRSEEHTSELQSPCNLVCRLLLEKKKQNTISTKSPAMPGIFILILNLPI